MGNIIQIDQLRACAEGSKNFVMGKLGEIVGTVADALGELHEVKGDKLSALSRTIPTTGWLSDATVADYPKYYDLTIDDVTSIDRATVNIAPSSVQVAVSCGICPTNETLTGKIRIRAMSIPEQSIGVQCWIEKGIE